MEYILIFHVFSGSKRILSIAMVGDKLSLQLIIDAVRTRKNATQASFPVLRTWTQEEQFTYEVTEDQISSTVLVAIETLYSGKTAHLTAICPVGKGRVQ